jgi:hypothetical protein
MSQGQGPTPAPDMGQQLFARGGGGSPKGAPANHGEDDFFKIVKDGLDNSISFLKNIPLLGSILARVLPSDAGAVGLTQPFDTKGFFTNPVKLVNTGSGPVGNFLANLAKNGRNITDLAGGIAPGAAAAMMESMQSVSRGDLGSFSPPQTPDVSIARGRGSEMAMA